MPESSQTSTLWNVEIINNNDTYVEYNIDGIKVKIDKIKLNK